MTEPPKLELHTTWLDPVSGINWKYMMTYYIDDGSVELFDIKNKRVFLRQTRLPEHVPLDRYVVLEVLSGKGYSMTFAVASEQAV